MNQLAYITGIPGTGVRQALTKYKAWCVSIGLPSPEVLSIEEDFLLPQARKKTSEFTSMPEEDINIIDVLTLPKEILDNLWAEAFDSCLDRAESARAIGTNVLITFHTVWYHLSNREFLSCVDLRRLGSPRAASDTVITLVDDIYDIKARLGKGLFSQSLVEQSDYLDAHIKLLRVLDWRNFESLLSRKISQLTGGNHFVLATKHPIKTFHGLLFERNKPIVYLAHPISQVRRERRRAGAGAQDSHQLADRINELARALHSHFIVIEPTAVDELRFDFDATVDQERLILPDLSWRWPSSSYEGADILYEAPDRKDSVFGSNWASRTDDLRSRFPDKLLDEDIENLRQAAPSMLTLFEHIRMQIKSRDFTLVGQADGLVVYRPGYEGHESGGVHQEIVYHSELAKGEFPRALAVIYHPESDEHLVQSELLIVQIKNWHRIGELEGNKDDLQRLCSQLNLERVMEIIGATSNSVAGNLLKVLVEEFNLKFVTQSERGAMDGESITHARSQENARGGLVRELKSYIAQSTDTKVTVLSENLTVSALVSRVTDLLASGKS